MTAKFDGLAMPEASRRRTAARRLGLPVALPLKRLDCLHDFEPDREASSIARYRHPAPDALVMAGYAGKRRYHGSGLTRLSEPGFHESTHPFRNVRNDPDL